MRFRNFLVVGLLTMVACSYSDGPFEQVEGRFFDERVLPKIQDAITTEAEVRALIGDPIETSLTDAGATRLRYFSKRERENVSTFLFNKTVHTQALTQELVVDVVRGRVIKHDYSTKTEEGTR